MKKTFAIILSFVLAASAFAGCSSSSTPAESSAAPAESSSAAESSEAPSSEAESAPEAEADATDVVAEKAMDYFASFPEDKNVIQPADLFAKIDAGEDMFIMDIRQPDVYAESHIKGAVNIPFGKSIAESLSIIPDDKPVMVYCYTGQTSSQTAALLNVVGKYAKTVQSGFNNGISKVEGYEAYIDTEAVPLPSDSYPVEEAFQAAADKYYADLEAAKGSTFENFNFKPESLKEIIDAEDDSYLVYSVRQAEDYAKGHIPGAINNPFGLGMQEKFSELPNDKTIIVQCYSGQTSSQVMAILRLLGYNAYSLSGGMGSADAGTGWLGAGYEVVTD